MGLEKWTVMLGLLSLSIWLISISLARSFGGYIIPTLATFTVELNGFRDSVWHIRWHGVAWWDLEAVVLAALAASIGILQ